MGGRWPGWAPPEPADAAAKRGLLLFARTTAVLAPVLPGLRVALADVADARCAEALFLRALAAAQGREPLAAPELGKMGGGGADATVGGTGPDAGGVASGVSADNAPAVGGRGAERALPALAALRHVLAGVWCDGHAFCDLHSSAGPCTMLGARPHTGAAHAARSRAAERGPARGPAAKRSTPDTPVDAQGASAAAERAPLGNEGAFSVSSGAAAPAALEPDGTAAEGWGTDVEMELDLSNPEALDLGPEQGDQEGWGYDEELDLDSAGAGAPDPVAEAPMAPAPPAALQHAAGERAGGIEAEQRDRGAPAESAGHGTASPPGPGTHFAGEGWDSDELDVGGPCDPDAQAPALQGVPAPVSGWGSADEEVSRVLGAGPADSVASQASTCGAAPNQPPADSSSHQAPSQAPAASTAHQARACDSVADRACAGGGAPVPLHTCWAALLRAMLRAGGSGAEPVHGAADGPAAALREADAARAAGRLLVTDAEARALVDMALLHGVR